MIAHYCVVYQRQIDVCSDPSLLSLGIRRTSNVLVSAFLYIFIFKRFRCRIPFILAIIVCLNKPTSTCNVCLTSILFYFEPYAFDVHAIAI